MNTSQHQSFEQTCSCQDISLNHIADVIGPTSGDKFNPGEHTISNCDDEFFTPPTSRSASNIYLNVPVENQSNTLDDGLVDKVQQSLSVQLGKSGGASLDIQDSQIAPLKVNKFNANSGERFNTPSEQHMIKQHYKQKNNKLTMEIVPHRPSVTETVPSVNPFDEIMERAIKERQRKNSFKEKSYKKDSYGINPRYSADNVNPADKISYQTKDRVSRKSTRRKSKVANNDILTAKCIPFKKRKETGWIDSIKSGLVEDLNAVIDTIMLPYRVYVECKDFVCRVKKTLIGLTDNLLNFGAKFNMFERKRVTNDMELIDVTDSSNLLTSPASRTVYSPDLVFIGEPSKPPQRKITKKNGNIRSKSLIGNLVATVFFFVNLFFLPYRVYVTVFQTLKSVLNSFNTRKDNAQKILKRHRPKHTQKRNAHVPVQPYSKQHIADLIKRIGLVKDIIKMYQHIIHFVLIPYRFYTDVKMTINNIVVNFRLRTTNAKNILKKNRLKSNHRSGRRAN